MLIKYLLHLRSQPKAVRDRHAMFIAAGFTTVVMLLWVVTLPIRLQPITPSETAEEAARPLAALWERTQEQVANVFSSGSTTGEDGDVAVVATTTPSRTVPSTINLTAEDIEKAQAAAAVPYAPAATTTTAPRMVRIATTTATSSFTFSPATSTGPGGEAAR